MSKCNCSLWQMQFGKDLNYDGKTGLAEVVGRGMEITVAMLDLLCLKRMLLISSKCFILQYHVGKTLQIKPNFKLT